MGTGTGIEWTDATVNFWWGCTEVGPGCQHCYARVWDARTGGAHFGVDVPRRKIKGAATLIHRLDNAYSEWAADAFCRRENAKVFGLPVPNIGDSRRVFIQSMSDLFDLEVPREWFEEGWQLIEACDRLSIQIVTKRVTAVAKRLTAIGRTTWPQHAGLIITVVNQDEADRDIPRLLALKARLGIPWVGLSIEPMLGPIVLRPEWLAALDWIIAGGESGPNARPMHPDWARTLCEQGEGASVPFFFKQWGEWAPMQADFIPVPRQRQGWLRHDGRLLVAEREADLDAMEREEARADRPLFAHIARVGKRAAGRLLDGRTHDAFPTADCRLPTAELP